MEGRGWNSSAGGSGTRDRDAFTRFGCAAGADVDSIRRTHRVRCDTGQASEVRTIGEQSHGPSGMQPARASHSAEMSVRWRPHYGHDFVSGRTVTNSLILWEWRSASPDAATRWAPGKPVMTYS